ncbi:MAG: pentapeptide repeat-containing protein [Cyanobacteria bacterium J06649_4]
MELNLGKVQVDHPLTRSLKAPSGVSASSQQRQQKALSIAKLSIRPAVRPAIRPAARAVAISAAKAATKLAARQSASAKREITQALAEDVQQHVAILTMGVAIWNEWRVSEPLTRPNLQHADLRGMDLENANFAQVDLRGADLSGAYLYDADFQRANLRGANLTRAVLIGANLHRANLSEATLEHAYLAQSDLSNANLTRACLKESDLRSALLTAAKLTHASLQAADMTTCFDLTEQQLKSAEDGHLAYLDKLDEALPVAHSSGSESKVKLPESQTAAAAVAAAERRHPLEVLQPAVI